MPNVVVVITPMSGELKGSLLGNAFFSRGVTEKVNGLASSKQQQVEVTVLSCNVVV